MQLWGVFHVNESGGLNQTPIVTCDTRESAEKALKRFPQCEIACFQPPIPESMGEADVPSYDSSS